MNAHRTLCITKRTFRAVRNDPRSLALMFIAPILAMCVFGIAFSGDVKNVHVLVVNYDESTIVLNNTKVSFSNDTISNFDTDVLQVERMSDAQAAINKVKNGDAYAVIIFPKNFTVNVFSKIFLGTSGNTTVQLMEDKSNVNVANVITKSVSDALQKTVAKYGKVPVSLDTGNAIYGQNAKFIDFFVPGIMVFAVFLLTTLLTLISFVGERSSGNLDRLLATPLKESELVIGYTITFTIISMVQSMLILTIGVGVFGITITGNIVLAFGVIFLLSIVSLSLGILLSSLAKREAQAIQFLPLIIFPVFLLSGIFWPIEAIPSWLRPASYFIPPTYAVQACRSVMLRGWGLEKIWPDIIVLLGFAALFLSLAIWSLKRSKR